MKILLAYDGSVCADSALDDLPRAGLPAQAEVRILALAEVFLPPPWPPDVPVLQPSLPEVQRALAVAEQAVQASRTLAEQAGTRVQALFPAWTIQTEAYADSPSWGVLKQADAWMPDLIVVGSHSRSAVGRLVLGSVSQIIVTHARSAVRVARAPRHASDAPVRLLIGVDGSPDAEAAVAAMAARHWPPGSVASLVAVAEAPLPAFLARWLPSHDPTPPDWLTTVLNTMQHTLQAAGLDVTTALHEGDPKRLLPDLAAQWDADCLVVGARGLGRVERLFMGSVSTAVAARAPCSVEVIRPGTSAR